MSSATSGDITRAQRRHAAAQAMHRITGVVPRSAAAADALDEVRAAQVEVLAARADEPRGVR